MSARAFLLPALLLALLPATSLGEPLRIAVASNFHATLSQLADGFSARQGITVELVPGSSGALYAQLANGAPFDLFFSADSERPQLLASRGLATSGTPVIYAIGQLAFWQPRASADMPLDSPGTIAIAQPRLAPYGAAAMDWLASQTDAATLQARRVYGTSVSQAFHFVASGNADTGLVALSQVLTLPADARGYYRVLGARAQAPLTQAAVIMKHSNNPANAAAFLEYVLSTESQAVLRANGYLPATDPAQESVHVAQ